MDLEEERQLAHEAKERAVIAELRSDPILVKENCIILESFEAIRRVDSYNWSSFSTDEEMLTPANDHLAGGSVSDFGADIIVIYDE